MSDKNNPKIKVEDLVAEMGNQKSLKNLGLIKSDSKGRGAVNPGKTKGILEPDSQMVITNYDHRGIREKTDKMSFSLLREISKKVSLISSIHQTRIQQIRPFCFPSKNEEEEGYKIILKERDKSPSEKEKKEIKEIENFLFYTGYRDFSGAEDREDRFPSFVEKLTRDELTIDQVAIQPQYNRKGEMIAFHAMDSSTIKRTLVDRGFEGNKNIKYVQEILGRVVTGFTREELLFYVHNPRTDLRYVGYGYSLLEQCIENVTAWLYGMSYNKEVFNSSAMPKGFLSFKGEQLDQEDLEELQREWAAMFTGIKGMWKTPFLQYEADWKTMAPSNRDMEWNVYIQFLSSLVCAVHGIDPQEMGLRFNQAQNVLNENPEKKISYSRDRGLKDILSFHSAVVNRLLEYNPKWEKYKFCFTGFENKDQEALIKVDKLKIESFQTINEIRKERDLEEIEHGDIILNPQFIQYIQSKEQGEEQVPDGTDVEADGDGQEVADYTDEDFDEIANKVSKKDVDDLEEESKPEPEEEPEGEKIEKSQKIILELF